MKDQKQRKKKGNIKSKTKSINNANVDEKIKSGEAKIIKKSNEKDKSIKAEKDKSIKAEKDKSIKADIENVEEQEQLVCKECGVKIPKEEAEEFNGLCEECAGEKGDESYEEYPVQMWGD